MKASHEAAVLRSCEVIRPGAKLVSRRTSEGVVWLAVWRLEVDHLVSPDAKVPTSSRWRAQAISRIEPGGVWWWPEGQGSTRDRAIESAMAF